LIASAGAVAELEIESVDWERIQLVLRLRATRTPVPDPAELLLVGEPRAPEPAHDAMAPTRAWLDGGTLVARFNVMQGPGQIPLRPGRWQLSMAGPAASNLHITDPTGAAARSARVFPISGRSYVVAPSRTSSGELVLDITDEPVRPDATGGMARALRSLSRRLGRWRGGMFDAIYSLAWRTRRRGRRLLFTSDSRSELGGNLELVHDRAVERGLGREYAIRTMLTGSGAPRRLRDRIRLPWQLGRADVIVLDDYHAAIYRLPQGRHRIIQLWHAYGAFKTFDYSRVGLPGAPSPFGSAHKNYSLVTVGAEAHVPMYAEAFGIPESRVAATGIPRMDRFIDLATEPTLRDAAVARVYEERPELRDRMVILFAPTFRGMGRRTAAYDVSVLDYPGLHAVCVEKDAVLVIRMHPHIGEPLSIPLELADRLLDGTGDATESPDLLLVTDLLITDYSSIIYEYSVLDRPMLFFAHDLEEYRQTRDFYEPYEDFVPGRIVRTCGELIDAVRHDDYEVEKVRPFALREVSRSDGRSTDRIIDLIATGPR